MPIAELITIGTELLLGDILDTNAQYLAHAMRDLGIDLFRISTVGDNPQRIAETINQALDRVDLVITTGGLGPTVDDPTRDAVALALNTETEFHPELWEQIQSRFRQFGRIPTENNRRQAYVPVGAVSIANPVGTAPAFRIDSALTTIICLPGVPYEMEYLMQNVVIPFLHERYNINKIIKTRVLHAAGAGEAQIDDLIADLEAMSNPTVGLAAHAGQIDIRITAKALNQIEADALIQPVESALRLRLGKWIYGADQETLEKVALKPLASKGWSLSVIESGLQGALVRKLAPTKGVFVSGQVLTYLPNQENFVQLAEDYHKSQSTSVTLGTAIYPVRDTMEIFIVIISPQATRQFTRSYGGPPEYAPRWAVMQSLDIMRNIEDLQEEQ